jgi:cysteine-rich repeat protein
LKVRPFWAISAALALATGCSFDGSNKLAESAIDAAVVSDADTDPSNVGLGNGSDGELIVNSGNERVNDYTAVTAGSIVGESQLTVDDSSIVSAGDVIIVWQTTRQLTPNSGDQSEVSLEALEVGHYELHRVSNVSDNSTIQIESPLARVYVVPGAQVVRVPQFTDVTVESGNAITSASWNGETGGLLAFLTTGTLTLGGNLLSNNRGFRGGQFVESPFATGCTNFDEASPEGAEKGESFGFESWGASGYGNQLSGGGGGNCSDSGGGGGGHGAVGGNGGRSWQGDGTRDVGGRGGAPLQYSISTHMGLGGGGGAGHANAASDTNNGGRGGAAVWLGAERVVGAGRINSSGGNGGDANYNGGGGGGAGGVIRILATSITCDAVQANGGRGGSVNTTEGHGPGAGGAPGRIHLFTDTQDCTESLSYGNSGLLSNGDPWGATPACGDGTVFGDEQCDDGNQDNGDGCDGNCQTE